MTRKDAKLLKEIKRDASLLSTIDAVIELVENEKKMQHLQDLRETLVMDLNERCSGLSDISLIDKVKLAKDYYDKG